MYRIAAHGAAATVQRTVMLALVIGVAAIFMALSAKEAGASSGHSRADSDGRVPVVSSCWAGNSVGIYSWYSNGYTTQGKILINDCALDRLGAGPQDRQAVVAHERGHAKGLPHSSNPSSVMYPVIMITGR